MKTKVSNEKYITRFWSYVDKKGDDECWEWTRSKSKSGYGYFLFRKVMLTHRLAYECAHGEGSAKGKIIRHTCDNPPCCNPKHLVEGTHQDNANDREERGRSKPLKGDNCPWKKLTEKDVIEIKELLLTETSRSIAKKYAVDPVTILDIKLGHSWKNVGPVYNYKKNKKDIKTHIKKLLDRDTLDGVFLHHIDGNKKNKVPENVVVCPDAAYHSLLVQRFRAYEACGNADWIKCTYCKKYDDHRNLYQKKVKTNFRPNENFYRFHKDCQLEFQRNNRVR